MRPKRSTAARTAASASARLVTSSLTASRSFDSPKALDTRSSVRPDATTAWPAARAALAKSTPMPRPAPVINQTFLLITSSVWTLLFPEPLNPVRDLRPCVTLVRELCDREGERLQVPRDSQRSGVDGLKADIANQPRRHVFRIVVVAAVEKARPAPSAALRIKDVKQHFTRNRAEGRDDGWPCGPSLPGLRRPRTCGRSPRPVSFAFIGSEHVTITFPETSPACFNTSLTRDQWTARSSASASAAASRGVPAEAHSPASRASRLSFRSLCE